MAGKRLAVRDFAYKPKDHVPLLSAVDAMPDDVIFCIKATPHDFYPTFPDNPAFVPRARPKWIEYDTIGQVFGWGVFPCLVLDNLRARLAHVAAQGASGVSFRVEWERINDFWSLDTLNAINAIGGATIVRGEVADAESAWPIMRDALHTWQPDRAPDLSMTGPRVKRLMAEKQRAPEAVRTLANDVRAGDRSLPAVLHARVAEQFDRYMVYIEGFVLCADVCLYGRWADPSRWDDAGPAASDLVSFAHAIDRLDAFDARIRPLTEAADVPHQVVMLMDHRRVADIVREGHDILCRLQAAIGPGVTV